MENVTAPNMVLGCHPNAFRETELDANFEKDRWWIPFILLGIREWIPFFHPNLIIGIVE